jgi:hypothetical protein
MYIVLCGRHTANNIVGFSPLICPHMLYALLTKYGVGTGLLWSELRYYGVKSSADFQQRTLKLVTFFFPGSYMSHQIYKFFVVP